MIHPKRDLALKILRQKDPNNPEQLTDDTFALTGDPRLISNKILLIERYELAFELLILIIGKDYKDISPEEIHEPEEEVKEVPESPEEEPPSPQPAPEKEPETKALAVTEDQPQTEAELPDYYAILGVKRNATKEEVRIAYRKLAKKYHPDVLRGKNLSKEEMELAKRKMQAINDAWMLLGDDQLRVDFDKLWQKKTSYQPETSVPLPLPSPTNNIAINLTHHHRTSKEINKAINKASDFRNQVKNAGFIAFDLDTQVLLKNYLPATFTNAQLNTALRLYSYGVKSKSLEEKLDKTLSKADTTELENQSLYGVAYLIRSFEEAFPKQTEYLQTAYSPEIEIQTITPGAPISPSPNQFVFESIDGSFRPIVDKFIGRGTEIAKKKLTSFAKKAIEKGGKKLAKKAGLKLATKAGVAAAAQALGTTVPVIGNIAVFIATEVLPRLAKLATKLIPKGIRDWINKHKKDLALTSIVVTSVGLLFGSPVLIVGGVGVGVAGSGGFGAALAAIMAAIIIPMLVMLATWFGITALAIILFIALVYFIIQNSAYMVPYNPDKIAPYELTSAYIQVTKTAEPSGSFENDELPQEITYTITITPRQGSISNISFQSTCEVVTETVPRPDCPDEENIYVSDTIGEVVPLPTEWEPGNATPTPAPITDFPPPSPTPPGSFLISPSLPYVITYTRNFPAGDDFKDSLVIDTFTVTADAGGNTGERAAGSAVVIIGTPPTECPSGWPVGGTYNQGPYTNSSHRIAEAIDIGANTGTPVTARHSGFVNTTSGGAYGNNVQITNTCPGESFFSRYSHLSRVDVSSGQWIEMGEIVGLVGSTGNSTGPHLHYEFRGPSGPKGLSNPPNMLTPYVPTDLRRGCVGFTTCGSFIIP